MLLFGEAASRHCVAWHSQDTQSSLNSLLNCMQRIVHQCVEHS